MSDTPVMEAKPWWQSRMQIYNGIKSFLALVISIGTFLSVVQHQGVLPFRIDEGWLVFIVLCATFLDGIVNMWLRGDTTQPIYWGRNGGQGQ